VQRTLSLQRPFIPFRATHSVIASRNMGTPKDTLYFWGEGVCKHKTGDCRLQRLTGQKRSIRRISRKGYDVMPQGSLPRDENLMDF